MRLLTRYADRAHRYGYLSQESIPDVRRFLNTLDGPFDVRFALHAIVFDLGPSALEEELRFELANVHRVPRDRVVSLLETAPTRLHTRPALRPIPDHDLLDTAVPSGKTSVPPIGRRTAVDEAEPDANAVVDATDSRVRGQPVSTTSTMPQPSRPKDPRSMMSPW